MKTVAWFVIFGMISLFSQLVKAQEGDIPKGICVDIAGIDTVQLRSLFGALDQEFKGGTLSVREHKISCAGTAKILNIVRQQDSGVVQFVEFSKGDLFVVVFPNESRATASASLDMGFEYKWDLRIRNGSYSVAKRGVVSKGASEFKVSP
jgi:hypothetical protein